MSIDSKEPITDEWLLSCQFKWRQEKRQPNKHFTLIVNQFDESGRGGYGSANILLQRSGWKNSKGDYVGDQSKWLCWVMDSFGRTAFLGRIRHKQQVIQLAEMISGHEWNPANHAWGQTWPDDRQVKERDKA